MDFMLWWLYSKCAG